MHQAIHTDMMSLAGKRNVRNVMLNLLELWRSSGFKQTNAISTKKLWSGKLVQ